MNRLLSIFFWFPFCSVESRVESIIILNIQLFTDPFIFCRWLLFASFRCALFFGSLSDSCGSKISSETCSETKAKTWMTREWHTFSALLFPFLSFPLPYILANDIVMKIYIGDEQRIIDWLLTTFKCPSFHVTSCKCHQFNSQINGDRKNIFIDSHKEIAFFGESRDVKLLSG